MIHGHGDDLFLFGSKIKVNFSSNIPQRVDHRGLMNYLFNSEVLFSNYPDPDASTVAFLLAEYLKEIKEENILVTNGATEAIYLLAHLFQGKKSAIVVPTFREYQDACLIYGHSLKFVSHLSEIPVDSEMVWLCNPNNPTGLCYDACELRELIKRKPKTTFIIDQAYASYSVKEVLANREVLSSSNLVILGSLTKRFSIPGLRIGYAIADAALISKIKKLKMPWSVNSVAISAAGYLLENKDSYIIDKEKLHQEAKKMVIGFKELGIEALPTDCNFFLSKLQYGNASRLKDWLIDHYGILIRDASNFESLSPSYFRVAAQSPEENVLLLNALKEWTSSF